MEDKYLTIAAPAKAEFKDRASKFLAYAYPIRTAEEFSTQLEQLRKEHFKANHHCYAFRLGLDNNQFRANDDGEPGGTAGRPILGQIDSFGLTDTGIIVVRYFGGTKLGTSGLIHAYKTSAMLVLEAAEIIEKRAEDVYLLTFEYHLMSQVMNALKKLDILIVSQNFEEIAKVEIALGKSEINDMLVRLKAHIQDVSMEEAMLLEQIHGLEIAQLYSR